MPGKKKKHKCYMCGDTINIEGCSVVFLKKRNPLTMVNGFTSVNQMSQIKLCESCAEKERNRYLSIKAEHV